MFNFFKKWKPLSTPDTELTSTANKWTVTTDVYPAKEHTPLDLSILLFGHVDIVVLFNLMNNGNDIEYIVEQLYIEHIERGYDFENPRAFNIPASVSPWPFE